MSPSLAPEHGDTGVSPRTILVGVIVMALIAAYYFISFPVEYRHPIDVIDLLRETANFSGVLAVALWARRDIKVLNIGLVLLLISLWEEVVDEFTAEPHWIGTNVPATLAIVGLVLVTLGIREAARRRRVTLAEKARAEEQAARSHATLRAVVEGSPDAVWVKDLGGAYILANRMSAETLGLSLDSLIGRRDAEVLPTEVAERHVATDREAVQGHHVRYEDTQTSGGTRRTFLVSKGLVRDERGEPFGILGIARDISDRKAFEERLAHQATHDALTGLPNRPAFLERLTRELARTSRQPRYHLAVLFVDLDNFKDVNDRFGHSAGDELLVKMGDLLTQWVRPGDSVARYGGDEFTLLLQDVDGVGQAVQVAERIQQGVGTPVETSHGGIAVSVSIGIALSSPAGDSPLQLLEAADSAMYRAKTGGGNRHSVHVATVLPAKNEHRAEA